MGILSSLEPVRVFEIFELLSSVPHGSGNTDAISALCSDFAGKRGLRHVHDALNNVVIYKPASPGYEKEPVLVLQAHLDMVCASRPGDGIDMSRVPVKLMTDGEYVWADRTSLGGDDCIGAAMALAVLDDDSLAHPALEVVLTTDEETGMYGAAGIDPSLISGRRLINLDSEADGVFTVGCAGGIHVNCSFPLSREPVPEGFRLFGLKVSGLLGGHSGCEIDKERGNAVFIAARALYALRKKTDVRFVSLSAGRFSNVIPSAAEAVFAAPRGSEEQIRSGVSRMSAELSDLYAASDPGVSLELVTDGGCTLCPATEESTGRLLGLLISLPNGVLNMSPDFPGLVQTSLSLGVIKTEEDAVSFCEFIRSSSSVRVREVADRVTETVRTFGGIPAVSDSFPGWEYRRDSGLRRRLTEVYRRTRGEDPRIEITHGGLEVGLLADRLPGLDAVSVGPDLYDIHSVNEKVSVKSVGNLYGLLTAFLSER